MNQFDQILKTAQVADAGFPSRPLIRTRTLRSDWSFGEALDRYLDARNSRAHDRWDVVSGCFARWKTAWADRCLAEVDGEVLNRYLRKRERAAPSEVVEQERLALAAFLSWSELVPPEKLLPARVEPEVPERIAWTPDEQSRLLWACTQLTKTGESSKRAFYLLPMCLLALETGLRVEVLVRLSWGEVDLISRRVRTRVGTILEGRELDLHLPDKSFRALELLWQSARRKTDRPNRLFDGMHLPRSDVGVDMVGLGKSFQHAIDIAGIRSAPFISLRYSFARNQMRRRVSFRKLAAALDWGDDLGFLVALFNENTSCAA